MISLDWIPVICRKIGRHRAGRSYVRNRLHDLQEALTEWLNHQNKCASELSERTLSRNDRPYVAKFCTLLSKEITLLKIAVAHIEFWSRGGGDVSLARAQKAYAQAQSIWKRRVLTLQKISAYPQRYV